MMRRKPTLAVWLLAVAVGVFALVSANQARADDEKAKAKKPACCTSAEKADRAAECPCPKTAEKKTAKKVVEKKVSKCSKKAKKADKAKCDKAKCDKAKCDKAKVEKKAKPKKKDDSAKAKKTEGASLLSKIMNSKAAKGALKIEVKADKVVVKKKADAKKAKTGKKTPLIVRMKLTGSYPEAPESPSPFGSRTKSLFSLLKKFKQFAEDDRVAAVVLEVETGGVGAGKTHEIREAIGRVRAAGKPVYAFVTSVDGSRYQIASACDEVVMVPSGIMMIPGVHAEVTFYKGLLDKIGVQFEVLQMGKYKSAGETMSRKKMSGPMRESLEAVLDDRYEGFVRDVAKDRELEQYQVKSLIDEAFFMAPRAKKVGLIDQVAYLDAFLDGLPKKLKLKDAKVVSGNKRRRADIDVSGIGGMMKLVELMLGGKKTSESSSDKKVALVYAVGPIVEGSSESSLFGGKTLGSTTLCKAIRKAADDPKVVAIVLRVDSPGGSGVASDLIWRETVRTKKPIIVSMGNVAGSGGYYIAMGADKIIAEPGTITGSIGVIGGKLVMGDLYKKIGVTTDVISRGKLSGAFSSTDPFTPEEREGMMTVLRSFYRIFVSKAAKGRNMSYGELHKLAQGRIYSGEDALELGLIDQVGTLYDAIGEAKKAAGLAKGEKVEVIVLPKPKTFLEQLFEEPEISTDAITRMAGPLGPALEELPVIEAMAKEPILLWMPYKIEIR